MMMTTTMMINDDHVDGDDHDVDAAFLHPFPPPPEPTQSKMEVGNIKAGETSLSIQTFDSHVFDVQIQEKTVQVIKIDRTKGEAQKFEIRELASSETEDGSSNDKDEL